MPTIHLTFLLIALGVVFLLNNLDVPSVGKIVQIR